MNPKNILEEKINAFFNTLPLTSAERQSAADFLSGKAGHDALDGFAFEDLSSLPADSAIRLFRELVKSGERDVAAKLFSVLLAKGDSTCFRMIPLEVIDPQRGAVDLETDAAKKAAVYAALLGADIYPLDSSSRDRLVEIACGKAEILKQAIQFEKNSSNKGRFVLCAVYFMRKCRCGDEQEKPVVEEDRLLLEQYEEIAIESLDRMYPPFHLSVAEVKDAVRNGAVTEYILKLAGLKHGISMQTLRLVAGLAYLNYPLSGKLKDVVRICLAANMEETLEAINRIGLVSPMDIYTRGTTYDREFGLSAKDYIRWSAKKGHALILERQLEDNTEIYVEVMDEVPVDASNRMLDVVKKNRPVFYKELRQIKKSYGQNKLIDKLVNKLVKNNSDSDVIRAFLCGQESVDTLYPLVEKLGKNHYYSGRTERGILDNTDKDIVDGKFYRRIQAYMWLWRGYWFLRGDLYESRDIYTSKISAAKVVELFGNFDWEELDIAHQLSGVGKMEDWVYNNSDREAFHAGAIQVFGQYLKERREETLAAFAGGEAAERLLGLEILAQNTEENKAEILSYAEDGAKVIRQQLFELLSRQTGWRKEMEEMLASKKSSVRELAIRVFVVWQEAGTDCGELLTKVLEKEKSVKLKGMLQDALIAKDGGAAAAGKSLSQKELVEDIHKGGRRRSLSWAYETPFSKVHMLSGEEAGEDYLQAIFLYYHSMTVLGYNKNAEFLAGALRPDEFAVYVNELFDKWVETGAEAKKRWVLYAAAIHGGSEIIERLKRQLKEWPKQSRGLIACEAVQALSLNPLPQALITVDGLARKFKYRQVRTAAGNALDFAAEQLGISREELIDRIVPDLGFDEGLGRTFDYGERKFRVMITPALEFEVYEELEEKEAVPEKGAKKRGSKGKPDDGSAGKKLPEKNADAAAEVSDAAADTGAADTAAAAAEGGKWQEAAKESAKKHILGKKLKSLPAPGKRDDERKASEAYSEFKQMKKQMKEIISSQTQRLEQALSSARMWSVDAWRRLFVKNPVMHQFATGLIWGVYRDGKLVQSFRYMEDGSFNTQDEEEYHLPAGSPDGDCAEAAPSVESSAADGKEAACGRTKADPAAAGEEKSARQQGAKIGLVHPIELTEEDREVWKEQLADYEITQPFLQLERPIYTPEKGELKQRELSRFSGRVVNSMSLNSRLTGAGWYHGWVIDGGCVDTFWRDDKAVGLGAELNFSGCFVGFSNEDVTIGNVCFYRIGKAEPGCPLYEVEDKQKCLLEDVPAKYFSEIVLQVERAAGAGKE